MPVLSVIIPAHNEEDNIGLAVMAVREVLDSTNIDGEIIVVNDNSTDGTQRVVEELSSVVRGLRLVNRKDGRKGFGLTVMEGIKAAEGNYILPFMADLSDDPQDIPRLLKVAMEGYDVVVGSRFIEGGGTIDYPKIKLMANRLYNLFIRTLFGLKIKDCTNAFKLYDRKIIAGMELESRGFEINAEAIIKVHLKGARIAEVPTIWRQRKKGKAKMKLLKVSFSYGLIAIKLFLKSLSKNFT